MADAPRSKGTDNVLCKICNHRHAFRDPHIFGGSKPSAPSVKTIDVTPKRVASAAASPLAPDAPGATSSGRRAHQAAGAGVAMPQNDAATRSTSAPSPSGKAPDFDSGTVRLNRAGATSSQAKEPKAKPTRAKGRAGRGSSRPSRRGGSAGTNPRKRPAIAVAHTIKELRKMADDASERIAKKPAASRRGRPKTVDDRKAYLAEKARARRAKKKENPDAV